MMFAYEVKYLLDICSEEIGIDAGVVNASFMSDAAKIIEDFYDDLLISVNLTSLDCSTRNMVSLDCVKEHFHLTDVANS